MVASSPSSTRSLGRLRRALSGRSLSEIVAAAYKTVAQKLARLSPASRAAARRDRSFDAQWGTDTSREVPMSALDFPAELKRASNHYQASGAHIIDEAIACAGIEPSEFVFVDYGCGKGRIVLLAAARPFIAAIGVEYSPLLTQIARDNAQAFVARGGAPVAPRFWQGNAADYVPPAGNVFAYLYNAFGADILAGCLDRFEAAKSADPARRIILAYVNPQLGDLVRKRAAWREINRTADIHCFECGAAG